MVWYAIKWSVCPGEEETRNPGRGGGIYLGPLDLESLTSTMYAAMTACPALLHPDSPPSSPYQPPGSSLNHSTAAHMNGGTSVHDVVHGGGNDVIHLQTFSFQRLGDKFVRGVGFSVLRMSQPPHLTYSYCSLWDAVKGARVIAKMMRSY